MLCRTCRRLLVGYAEEELDERTRLKVEAHLARCGACSSEFETVRKVGCALRKADIPAATPAPDSALGIIARVSAEVGRQRRYPRLRLTQIACAWAAALFVGVVGYGLLAPGTFQRPEPTITRPLAIESHVSRDSGSAPANAGGSAADQVGVGKPLSSSGSLGAPVKTVRVETSTPRHKRFHIGQVRVAAARDLSDKGAARMAVAQSGVVGAKSEVEALADIKSGADGGAGSSRGENLSAIPKPVDTESRRPILYGDYSRPETSASALAGLSTPASGFEVQMAAAEPAGAGSNSESIVDALTESEGVWQVALFSYP
ncbi:MAG: zf-HC2 domain-containing protein [Armatimonadota bacterium]|nr:zf-HC2 domain-containing protein [Armatimonadota bacterium]